MKKTVFLALAIMGFCFLMGIVSCSGGGDDAWNLAIELPSATGDATTGGGDSSGAETGSPVTPGGGVTPGGVVNSNETITGKISGKALYSNLSESNHSGIIVALEKTDGLRTASVCKSLVSRSVVNSTVGSVSSCVTTADGSYSFDNLEAGTYTVYASSSYSKERAVSANVVVRSNQTTVAETLKLTATGSIEGNILIDGKTTGNTGILVFVAGTSYMAMTDDAGKYVISDVPARENYYQLVATKNGVIRNLSFSILVVANKTTTAPSGWFFTSELEAGLKGSDGASMVWLGSYSSGSQITNPQKLDAYFNTTDGCSYIYDGTKWTLLARSGSDGKNGTSIVWKGESYTAPLNPEVNWAYFDKGSGCSYIWTGTNWDLLARSGTSIAWMGELYTAPSNPQRYWAYYNTTDGCSYIWTGANWDLLAKNGATGSAGTSIVWKGESYTAPSLPELNWAYYNTADGCSYIWNGTNWDLLSKGGANGADGVSIVWKGERASAPSNPEVNWAYYNTARGCSYIWNGRNWDLLSMKGDKEETGADGAVSSNETGIRWRGTFASASQVPSPQPLDAYYNSADGCSYIYTGSKWTLLAQNGLAINWLGNFANSNYITNPKKLDAYYNTTENCSYIYNGSTWTVLAKGPASGGTGGSSTSVNVGSEVGAVVDGTTLVSWTNPTGVIRIPSGVTDISPSVFSNKDSITRVIIPSSVVNIGKQAFYDCDGITSVEFLGTGLKIIGENAFGVCTKLANITLPNTVQSIGVSAFNGCKNLTTVNIPDSVVFIGASAYSGCSLLRTLTIGSGVTELKGNTFYNCDALVSVSIPDTVTVIGENVFNACDSLVSVSISGTWCYNEMWDTRSNVTLAADNLKKSDSFAGTWYRE